MHAFGDSGVETTRPAPVVEAPPHHCEHSTERQEAKPERDAAQESFVLVLLRALSGLHV